jgi:hypothetical protein
MTSSLDNLLDVSRPYFLETTMTTHFITAEVALNETNADLQAEIAAQLKNQGEPLRWAITSVDERIAQVEAVILQDAETQSVT